MTDNNINTNNTSHTDEAFGRRREHVRPEKRNSVFFIRQVLNLLFMVLAVVGLLMYMGVFGEGRIETAGIIVILTAVCFKMSESVIRVLKKETK